MKKIKASEFDQKFDDNEDVSAFIDWDKAKRGTDLPMRVSIDFPRWMIASLDKEAAHLGLSRQALIKLSVADHIRLSQYVVDIKEA
jgi:hypothetical protein